jgi:hypothetical protein
MVRRPPQAARSEQREEQDRDQVAARHRGKFYPVGVSVFAVVLLAAAVVLLAVAEWPRLAARFGLVGRERRSRAKRKAKFRVVESDPDERDDFAASVERDLAALPTYDPRDANERER